MTQTTPGAGDYGPEVAGHPGSTAADYAADPRERIGYHVGNEDPIAEAAARGADAVQIFLGDPQSWKAPTVAYPGGAAALRAAAEQADVALYVHAAYIINVAHTNNRIRIPSRKLL